MCTKNDITNQYTYLHPKFYSSLTPLYCTALIIYSAYAGKKGIDVNSMRFMLDGEAVDFNQTPSDLDLEDNDQIDCFLQQVGGAVMMRPPQVVRPSRRMHRLLSE